MPSGRLSHVQYEIVLNTSWYEMGNGGLGHMKDVSTTDGSDDNKGNGNDSLPLKNAQQAQIDPAKFDKYSMDPNNPNNQGKWKAFEGVGYNVHIPEGRSEGA